MTAVAIELRVPQEVLDDPESRELLRVWLSGESQRFVLRPDVWDDPAAWGLLLADLARHVAYAYAQKQGGDPERVLERIKAGFDAEWISPTDA